MQPDKLTKIADQMKVREFRAGEVVIRQGDAGDAFYLIRSGEAEVTVKDIAGERTLAVLDEGKFFGEMALETGEPRTATVRAKSDLRSCALDKESYRAVKEATPTFQEEISKTLFERQH